jgi:hypothetical protein
MDPAVTYLELTEDNHANSSTTCSQDPLQAHWHYKPACAHSQDELEEIRENKAVEILAGLVALRPSALRGPQTLRPSWPSAPET